MHALCLRDSVIKAAKLALYFATLVLLSGPNLDATAKSEYTAAGRNVKMELVCWDFGTLSQTERRRGWYLWLEFAFGNLSKIVIDDFPLSFDRYSISMSQDPTDERRFASVNPLDQQQLIGLTGHPKFEFAVPEHLFTRSSYEIPMNLKAIQKLIESSRCD